MKNEEVTLLNNLSDDWNDIKELVVFGYGRTSVRNIDKLSKDFEINIIIDNDPEIHGKKYKNCTVCNFEEAKHKLKNNKIVVSTSSVAYASISKMLQSIGLVENKDFCRLKDFMAEWYWKNRKEVCLSQTFSSINSRCTFRCKHCNFFMPYFECDGDHYEYDENEILADFDGYFKLVDYVASWSIIGGEPLLNKRLPYILKCVFEKYGDRIGYIQVISNGTIVPSKELIDVMKACNVRMRLSDYTHQINYNKKLSEVKQCLEENEIPYDMSIYKEWFDLGTRTEVIPEFDGNHEATANHMRACATGCHQLNDRKFFFCGQGFARSKKGLCVLEDGDYISVDNCKGTVQEKEQLLNYCMGYPSKGYISVCSTCYGMGSDNNRIVPVAEQMKI